ncbi:DUF3616 domain-containing protein [Trichocoleus sp. FACHB-591]|uniref:DUF3616 domain-containing protein n=1 Tax=Trichocoleus sp. FACHB-591 TaxID=2692872 RepID=UPI001685F62E|nr:DUF3616 domain-containing protein [Trichocoleus sp. FACHB-591]MBD2098357.1 DUF3616 domain-containing protein [Trichocoleus sp. FACHB-591]
MKTLLKTLILSIVLVFIVGISRAFANPIPTSAPVVLQGMCDASAILKINSQFLVLNDEDQETTFFRLFDFSKGGKPISAPVLPREKLQIDSKNPEIDFEGLAQVGDVYFALASHSRNKNFKPRDSRKNLVAFRWKSEVENPIEVLASLQNLVPALQAKLKSTEGVGISEIDRAKDPKQDDGDGGLSIEGISAMPNGNLLIGLRSPTNPSMNSEAPRQAIAVELVNPLLSVTSNNVTLGNVHLWQFNGAGIRDLDYDGTHRQIIILSGPPGAGDTFKIWTWDGNAISQPTEIQDLTSYKSISQILAEGVVPEGITIDNDHLWVVFDEGKRKIAGAECKSLTTADQQKTFRAVSTPYNFKAIASDGRE